MRGGTTSLYVYLAESSGISRPLRKEIHFFDDNYGKGWAWYLAHFPVRNSSVLTGEGSPNYMFYPVAMQRIADTLPNAKLIALLRNPIERAYSHYWHEVSLGYETLPFEDALNREYDMDNNCWRPWELGGRGIYEHEHFSYLSRGLYVKQLKPWMEKISRNNFLILKSEALFNDPGKVLSEALTFLGRPPSGCATFRKYNEEQYSPMSDITRARLRSLFRPYNEELSELLGMDFSQRTLLNQLFSLLQNVGLRLDLSWLSAT
jgi:hypothetical protein